jgi:hypothetical protein
MARSRSGGARSEPLPSPAPAEQPLPAPAEAVPAPAQPAPVVEQPPAPVEAAPPPVAPAQALSEPTAPAPEEAGPPPAPVPEPLEAAPEESAYTGVFDEPADELKELAPPDDLAQEQVVFVEPVSPNLRGRLATLDEEHRGVQAMMEAVLHAQLLESQQRSPAYIEVVTGMRRTEDGFDIVDSDAVASAAGRGPYFNTVMPELEQQPARPAGNPATHGRPFVSRFRDEQPPPFTQGFTDRLPDTTAAIEAELRRMLPAEVAVKLANRITLHGHTADEVVSAPNAFNPTAPWMLAVALERGPATAKIKGFHGIAANTLRGYGRGGLYTQAEWWRVLLERAEKEGMRDELQNEPMADSEQSLWDFYLDAYARHGAGR